MLIAVEYLGSVGVGVTGPQFFRADDEKIYVVKLQNNPLGPKVLVNEFLAAKFGTIMDLCFPPGGIIEINKQTLQKSQCPMTPEISLGHHFASLYLEHTEYVGKHNLSQGINIGELAGVMLFDHMFHNTDRVNNKRNVLMRQEDAGYKIYAIDNSHLFRSGRWTFESLTSLDTRIKPYYRYLFGILLKDYLSPQDFLPYLKKVAIISNEDIETIVAEIPEEWLPDKPERQELVRHIKMQRDMTEKIWDTLCGYIPKARGGYRWLYGRTMGSRDKGNFAKGF